MERRSLSHSSPPITNPAQAPTAQPVPLIAKKGSKGEQTQGNTGASTEQQTQGSTKAQTNEQAQGKAGTATEQQAQGKTDTNCSAGMKNCKQGSNTGEQAQGKTGTTTNQAQGNSQTQTNEQAQGKTGTTTNQAQGSNAQDQGKTASINNVTVEQKTQITNVIKETKVEPVSNVDFDISVGVEVPRQKIHLHRLPSKIVKIVPAYEGYEYFVLADGRIVIVDPNTYKIVLVLT